MYFIGVRTSRFVPGSVEEDETERVGADHALVSRAAARARRLYAASASRNPSAVTVATPFNVEFPSWPSWHPDNPYVARGSGRSAGPPPGVCARDQVGVATPEAVQWPLPSAVMWMTTLIVALLALLVYTRVVSVVAIAAFPRVPLAWRY